MAVRARVASQDVRLVAAAAPLRLMSSAHSNVKCACFPLLCDAGSACIAYSGPVSWQRAPFQCLPAPTCFKIVWNFSAPGETLAHGPCRLSLLRCSPWVVYMRLRAHVVGARQIPRSRYGSYVLGLGGACFPYSEHRGLRKHLATGIITRE